MQRHVHADLHSRCAQAVSAVTYELVVAVQRLIVGLVGRCPLLAAIEGAETGALRTHHAWVDETAPLTRAVELKATLLFVHQHAQVTLS